MSKFSFINELLESPQFPSLTTIKNTPPRSLAEITFLHLIALEILKNDEFTNDEARVYARKTIIHGADWSRPLLSGTDLYQLLYGFSNLTDETIYLVNLKDVHQYLRNIAFGLNYQTFDRRFLLSFEKLAHISNDSYRALRRMSYDWNNLDREEKSKLVTRLLQALRLKAPRSTLRQYVEKLSARYALELKNVCNVETGANCNDQPEKPEGSGKFGLLKALAAVGAATAGYHIGKRLLEDPVEIKETTTAGNVASVAGNMGQVVKRGGLGVGLDPDGDWGIYPKPTKKAKKSKNNVIKRT